MITIETVMTRLLEFETRYHKLQACYYDLSQRYEELKNCYNWGGVEPYALEFEIDEINIDDLKELYKEEYEKASN
jgi:hypothetical protein